MFSCGRKPSTGLVGWGATNTVPNWSYETIETVTGTLRHHLVPLAIGKTPFELNMLKEGNGHQDPSGGE